jgi:diguanylate cyclase (GGDEF)-like protein
MISFEDHLLAPAPPGWTSDAPSLALAEVIGASLDLTETLRAASVALRMVTGADRAVIFLYDAAGDTLRQVTTTVDQMNWDELVSVRGRALGDLPLWYAVRDSSSGILELPDTVELRALTPGRARRIGMAGCLGLALRHPSIGGADDETLAIAFCMWDTPQQAFEQEMVRRAHSIAAQAAVAIANARNYAHGEELVRRLSGLATWAARLAASGTPQQLKARAARAASVLLDAPLVAHWSPGAAAWYPASPLPGEDYEPELALLAARIDRFQSQRSMGLAPTLAEALHGRDLTHTATSVAGDRGSLLFVARATTYTAIDEQVASLLTDLSGSALRTAEAHARVAHLALTDPLTDVGNRRAFELRVAETLALSVRSDRPLSLCLIDLDNFRVFNETGGHQMGDDALRLLATTLRAEMRTSDQAFRIGGDEFALVLADTPAASAVSLLQRVLATLRTSHLGSLSITAGVAEAPGHGSTVEGLYNAADSALYTGKRAGRARVTLATNWG